MSRLEETKKLMKTIGENTRNIHYSTDNLFKDMQLWILYDIAKSLSVIADKMTESEDA